jgi:hypothetical protein
MVNILATSGPYYFLQDKPLRIEPPRRQSSRTEGWKPWWLRWTYSAVAAIVYNFIMHHTAVRWVLPYIREYHPLARQVFGESSLNKGWLLCSFPFISIAVWHFFKISNHPFPPHLNNHKPKDFKDSLQADSFGYVRNLNLIKRVCVFFVLCSVITLLQIRASQKGLSKR